MSDNVIPLNRGAAPTLQQPVQTDCDVQLEMLSQVRQAVERGDLTNLMIIARNPRSGHFFTDFLPVNPTDPTLAFAMVGVLTTLRDEITDVARMSPTVLANGAVISSCEGPLS